MTGVAEGLATTCDVHVLCSQPTYSSRGTLAPVRESRGGVEIERCAGTRFDKDRIVLRLVNLVTISLSIAWTLFRRVRRGDFVLVVTNPPSLPFVVYVAALLRGARVVLRIEDVYPEVLVAAGMSSPRSSLVRVVGAATRLLYRRMERVVVLGRDMAALAAEKLGDRADRIVLISNWGDVESITPLPRASNPVLTRIGAADRFVVQYMGNMGRTHGVDTVAAAALALRDDADLYFLFVGWGARKSALEQMVADHTMVNVAVLPGCPQEDLPMFANACDLSIIAFQRGMAGVSVPSRMYNVMAAGKPILAVADAHSELARVVVEEQIGWVVPPGDVDGIIAAVRAASAMDRAEFDAMGARSREVVVRKYSQAAVNSAYVQLAIQLERTGV